MLEIQFLPFKNIETSRLLLRRITTADVSEILALRGNPGIMEFIPRPLATSAADALGQIAMIEDKIQKNEGINWAITLKPDSKLIGLIGHYRIQPQNYRAEIGYMILPEFENKGIIPEAIKEVVKYGFKEMNLHSIEAVIDPRNLKSARVLEKNGFVKEAHLLENEYYDGEFYDSAIYSLLKRNFTD